MPGIVYVLSNPAMPGMVKIGMTEREDYGDRLAELYATGVPYPFHCELAYLVDDPRDVEGTLHAEFADDRVNPDREFFEIEVEEVRETLTKMEGANVTKEVINAVEAISPVSSVRARNEARQRNPRIDFNLLKIESGAILSTIATQTEVKVVGKALVELDGRWMTLAAATRQLLPGYSGRVIDHWEVDGQSLADILAFTVAAAARERTKDSRDTSGTQGGRAPNLDFGVMGIRPGSILVSVDSGEEAIVIDDKHVRFRGVVQRLTPATTAARNGRAAAHPTTRWTYRAENVGNRYVREQRWPWERGES